MSVSAPRPAAPPIITDEVKAGVAWIGESCAGLGHTVVERDPDGANIGNDITPRYLGGIAKDGRAVPTPSGSRADQGHDPDGAA